MNSKIIESIKRELGTELEERKSNELGAKGYILDGQGKVYYLNLSACKITDLNRIIPKLRELKELTILDLYDNEIVDTSALNSLTQLTHLSLAHNKIVHLSLSELTNIIQLILDDNEITDISCLKGLSTITELYLSDNNITDIRPLKPLTGLGKLFLNNNQLIDIKPLQGLIQISELGLSSNRIKNIGPLKNLSELFYLNLNENQFTDLTPLMHLQKLTRLSLSGNQLIDIDALKGLEQITSLDLTKNKIADINPLRELRRLEILSLSENQIQDISALGQLGKLTELYLLGNQLSEVTPLANLTQLKTINLGRNNIADISALKNLENLKVLWLIQSNLADLSILSSFSQIEEFSLGECNIDDITFVKDFKKLKRLDLQSNKIYDIRPLKLLKDLKQLNLNDNRIVDISPLKDLKKLNQLQLQKNPMTELPSWIVDFEMEIEWHEYGYHDGFITLYDNTFKIPPVEIVKQGKKAIRRYFNKIIDEGVDYIYEAKLTFVGEGSSGKTSLQRRLLNENAPLPRKDKRTRGIEIKDWIFKKGNQKIHLAHIWDFGGQDVYYPVHRFFITENSVFVLLASTRQTHHNFDYWIPTIYQFGGKSPIILGQTCHDGNKISWNDLGAYVGNPNFNIIKTDACPYYEVNLLNHNEGLSKIRQTIVTQITSLKHYGKGVPKSWVPVRNILSEESKKTECISFEKFKEICKNSDRERFNSLADLTDCCQFLHDLGVVLWYSANEELKNWVILQPKWVMNAVYKIIDDEEIQKRGGNIIANDFPRLWSDQSYEDKHPILKKLLEIFKIAFPKKHRSGEYIIPARLLSMPAEEKWPDTEPYLRLEYRYEFMPRGMVNQVSGELSRYIVDDEKVWNNAVNLVAETNNAKCQIEEDFYNRKITIKAKGKDARGMIVLVMNSLKNITEGYKGVRPEVYVPCICNECKINNKPTTFLYEKLIDWSESRQNARVTCNESGDSLLIEELLFNVGLQIPERTKNKTNENYLVQSKKIFISYSKHDEEYLQSFQEHLVTLKREGLVTFDCRQIEFGDEWDVTIKNEIEQCEILVCLVSVKFLNTDYIQKIEIPNAIEQNKIIIPIIIKACDWETSELGKYQASQKGRVVSLDNNLHLVGSIKGNTSEEKDAFWTAIIKEFRKKILT